MTEVDLEWDDFRRGATGLPPIRWPRIWEHVYEEIASRLAAEAAARRKAAASKTPFGLIGLSIPSTSSSLIRSMVRLTPEGTAATSARRYDNLLTAHQVALQQVADYEGELRRLREAHAEIVRPDVRLWWGVGIVVVFAAVGVALPLWIMAQGPKDLASVRWLFWVFATALASLLAYIVVYLAQLTRAKPSR